MGAAFMRISKLRKTLRVQWSYGSCGFWSQYHSSVRLSSFTEGRCSEQGVIADMARMCEGERDVWPPLVYAAVVLNPVKRSPEAQDTGAEETQVRIKYLRGARYQALLDAVSLHEPVADGPVNVRDPLRVGDGGLLTT